MGALDGRVAIVTGASYGIGKGVAHELALAGATVYGTGRSIDAVEGGGIAVRCDHRRDDEVEALFSRVMDEQGRLDVLVNNAFLIPKELTSRRPFWEVPISNWDDMIDVGTRSAYVASWYAAPLMVKEGRGLIANVSSSGAQEYAWHVVYGVGKCALDRLTADAAHELRDHGVAVVSLWPGLVLTERTRGAAEVLPTLDFSGAESQRFTGRAVAALAADPDVQRWSGRAIPSRDLADTYHFTDVEGTLPAGPLHGR